MKPVNIKKKYDIAYCIFVGVAFIVVIIWQIFHLPLPSWLLTDLPLTDSSFVILQIQVTIAVLPLAIIALITGMSKDTLYGVPVLKYVLRLRPVLLTYNSVAILQMFMIIIAFVSTSYQWYNLLELTFFVTLFNSLILMTDCFSLLSNYQLYKSEIRSYLVSAPTQEKFSTVVDDIIKSASTASIDDLKEELSAMNEMLLSISGDTDQTAFNSEYIKCANRLFGAKNSDLFFCMTDALQNAYCSFNEKKKEFPIFRAICFEFYNGLKYLDLADARKRGGLDNLRFKLFRNPAYSDTEDLRSFTAQIYQLAVVENIYPLNAVAIKDSFVIGMYDWFSPFRDFSLLERYDRLNFFKSLVDNRNETILSEKVYSITDIHPDTDLVDKLFIVLYFYYIAKYEPLADKEQIQFCGDFIRNHRTCFHQVIASCAFPDVSNDDTKLSYDLMKSWEVIKPNCVKTLTFDSVTNDFWIFSFMAVDPSIELLSDILQSFAVGKEFKLYSQYFSDSTASTRTKQKYHDFCDLFGFDFNETSVNLFRSALSETYKQYSIHEAIQEHDLLMNDGDFLSKWTQVVKDYCGLLSGRFSDKPAEVTSNPTVLVNCYEFCFELSRKENERLKNTIEASILAFVCRVIQSHLKIENVKFGEPLSPIINVLNDSASNPVDTVIGSRNCFSYRERNEEQQILEKFGEEFLSRFMTGAIFFVSRSGFFADFSNIKVHLLEPTREEILAKNKPNENGTYSYIITNDLKGDFTEDELVTFIQNRFVNLKITCDFTYGFSSEQIGYGIIRQLPQD